MGTRSSILVQIDGEYRIGQYCQWDGYPGGQGMKVLGALGEIVNMGHLDDFRSKVRNLKLLTFEEVQDRWKECGADDSGFVGMDVVNVFASRYPSLERRFGGKIIQAVANGSVNEVYVDSEFHYDGLFCEWCYVIDLDKNTFEVYSGFHKDVMDPNERFTKDSDKFKGTDNEYAPVQLLREWSLDALPTDREFLALDGDEDDEDDEE